MRLRSALRLASAALLAGGCSDPVSPDEIAGVYVLRRVGDVAIPGRYANSTDGDSIAMAFDTLMLAPDGSAWQRQRYTVLPATGGAFVSDATYVGSWTAAGPAISVSFGCPVGTFCAASLVATPPIEFLRVDEALVMTSGSIGPFLYHRARLGIVID